MTKKDYELIAKAISDTYDAMECTTIQAAFGVEMVARNLATALASANPRFDRERFLKACGVTV